jgi:hypothetical protein
MSTQKPSNLPGQQRQAGEAFILANHLPPPWMINEIEELDRQERHKNDNRPRLELPLPYWEEGAPGERQEEKPNGRVVVIEL